MPTLVVGMWKTREKRHMPTTSVGMAPDFSTTKITARSRKKTTSRHQQVRGRVKSTASHRQDAAAAAAGERRAGKTAVGRRHGRRIRCRPVRPRRAKHRTEKPVCAEPLWRNLRKHTCSPGNRAGRDAPGRQSPARCWRGARDRTNPTRRQTRLQHMPPRSDVHGASNNPTPYAVLAAPRSDSRRHCAWGVLYSTRG